jgi:hypothetical protein
MLEEGFSLQDFERQQQYTHLLDYNFFMKHSDNDKLVQNLFFGVLIIDFSHDMADLDKFILSQDQYLRYANFRATLAKKKTSSETHQTVTVLNHVAIHEHQKEKISNWTDKGAESGIQPNQLDSQRFCHESIY